jgi:hypothetical protein
MITQEEHDRKQMMMGFKVGIAFFFIFIAGFLFGYSIP